MRVESFRVVGIRCFEDSGDIFLSDKINLFVGRNNAGKSTLLKSLIALQGFPFHNDFRLGSLNSYFSLRLIDISPSNRLSGAVTGSSSLTVRRILKSSSPLAPVEGRFYDHPTDSPYFSSTRPYHFLVPFLARRKAAQLDQNITSGYQAQVTGTFSNLNSRIDLVASGGHPRHQAFHKAVNEIIGLPITTRASANGKESGFYLDDDNFVVLDKMGDGVTEMVALIVELCLERGKVFVLEEPESYIHPRGLKALLAMIRDAAEYNQFVIATHSNIVVRELGFDPATRLFRVSRDEENPLSPSEIEVVPREADAHIALLRELGYDFADFRLHDAWLFLEESSAEQIIEKILIPYFVPALSQRLRTYSAGGVTNIEPRFIDFQHLVTFIHLEPAYKGRVWIRTDGDDPGRDAVAQLRQKFSYLDEETCKTFTAPAFENYYPSKFRESVVSVLAIKDKKQRKDMKLRLLRDVLAWTEQNLQIAKEAWRQSADEPIQLLKGIEQAIA